MTIHLAQAAFSSTPAVVVLRPLQGGFRPFRNPRLYSDFFKRALDIGFVLATALFTLPLVVLVAALVARDGHNPFFCQIRLGRNGKTFRMLKLRTMVPNAEEYLQRHLALNPAAAIEWAETQKLRDDPRVTSIGALLRCCSLDELPQLWNVLVGDMSLVGPRPMLLDQRPLYPGNAYETLRPGVTGLWQVTARNTGRFADRALYDSQYAQTVSLLTDINILVQTLKAVGHRTGC